MASLLPLVDSIIGHLRRRRPRPKKPSGVLLISAGGLGDTVLFTVVLPRLLRLAQPDEDITILLRADAAKMSFLFPPEITVEAIDFGRLLKDFGYRHRAQTALHDRGYRLVVATDHLRHPWLDEALAFAADAPETVAMVARHWPKHERRLTANERRFDRLFESGPNLTDKVMRLGRFADWLLGEETPPQHVVLPDNVLPTAAKLDLPTVFVQPFSAVREKQSPVELYRRIFAALPAEWRIVITGAPDDLERNADFQALLDPPRVSFDDSTFAELLPRLLSARFVVSVDTALMHLSAAAGVPTLCLASAAYVGEIVPYDDAVRPANAHAVHTPMPCQGCLGHCSLPTENGMFPCVARLDADRILAEVGRLVAA